VVIGLIAHLTEIRPLLPVEESTFPSTKAIIDNIRKAKFNRNRDAQVRETTSCQRPAYSTFHTTGIKLSTHYQKQHRQSVERNTWVALQAHEIVRPGNV
jgi:hypothetical protein